MKNILYFFPVKSSFVESDLQLLLKHHHVKPFFFKAFNKSLIPLYFINQFFFILFRIRTTHVLLSQFSGYHSFLPALMGRLFRKPHFTILHGTECNNFPEYHYGYLSKPLLFWFSKKSLEWSEKILPVSEALVSSAYTYRNTKFMQQGLKAFYPSLKTPIEVIHHGISGSNFIIQTDIPREPGSFITVATGFDSSNRRFIKGIDLVIELAKATPEYHYTLLGADDGQQMNIPENITLVGYVPNKELAAYYNRNMFYLQLSVSEGFGISVGEGMLCGCVPIVSNVGILPAIAGPEGYVLTQKNLPQLLTLVNKAVSEYDPEDAVQVRKHITEKYSPETRERNLLHVLKLD